MNKQKYLIPISGNPGDAGLMQEIMRNMLDARKRRLGVLKGPADRAVLSFSAILISLKSAATFFY